MSQQPVEVGSGGFAGRGLHSGAGGGEELRTGHTVKVGTQTAHTVAPEGIIVEEDIRAVQSHIKESAETLNRAPDLRGKAVHTQKTKPVMGVICRHNDHLTVDFCPFYNIFQKIARGLTKFPGMFHKIEAQSRLLCHICLPPGEPPSARDAINDGGSLGGNGLFFFGLFTKMYIFFFTAVL
jgi:hypothetical protein